MADAVPGALADPSAVHAEAVAFGGAEGAEVRAYLARPSGDERPWPALLVLHEAFGLNDHVRDLCRRFAATGLVALAPDLYTREGAPDASDIDAVIAAMRAVPDERVVGDLEGAAAWLRTRPEVGQRLGCIGFCSGGRQTLLFACNTHALDVAVDCWGGRAVPLADQLDGLRCPLLLVVGAEDVSPSPEDARTIAERAAELGKDVRLSIYEDAGHAFLADYRPTYRPGPAHRLWDELTAYLGEHLLT